jgi:hypothetical protein
MVKMKKKLISLVCALTLALSNVAIVTASESTTTKKVLSGNALTDADRTLYSENYGINLVSYDTDATYRWSADTKTGIVGGTESLKTTDTIHAAGNESIYGEMIGGSIVNTTPNGTYAAWPAWQAQEWVTLDFDLGAVYSVSGVDIWEIASKGVNAKLGEVKIFAGETADNMKQVWTGTGAGSSLSAEKYNSGSWSSVSFDNHARTVAEFNATDARFIKIKLRRANSL